MKILDSTVIETKSKAQRMMLNIVNGTLVVTVEVDEQSFDYSITEAVFITLPENSVTTFSLNGDTASISAV